MATTEHCLFCFETLAAHLDKRKPLSLAAVQASYAAFVAEQAASAPGSAASAAGRATASNPTSSSGSSGSSGGSSAAASTASAASSMTSLSTPSTGGAGGGAAARSPPASSPLFVTWNTTEGEDDGEHALRGCIGTFEAQPLEEGLATYALTAALHDTRFAPVAKRELPHLEVAVTLLTDFEPASSVDDWELGTHGLRISFTHGGRRFGATYLPDVAPEQGWTKEQTLVSLMRKAGWTGRRDRWREIDVHVVRYQGKKAGLGYAAYAQWRAWAAR